MIKTTLLLILIFISFKLNSIAIIEKTIQNSSKKLNEYYYNLFIKELKKNEGFQANVYKCQAGFNTIGYGHQLKHNENFTFLTEKEATELLIKDFNECLKLVSHLSISKKFAAAHFIFCCGYGTYKLIEKDFKNKVLQCAYYKLNDKYIYSEYSFNRRKFEYENYN